MFTQYVIFAVCFVALALTIFGVILFRGLQKEDGIEVGKVYALAYTYKATMKGSGTPVRVFDFADRNLPRASITAPLSDSRGMPLVRENTSLPPSSIRKVVGRVPTSKVERVTYPGYSYVLWEYHLSVTGPQSVIPVITPSK
jgi:hypothetical protein